MEPRRQRSLFSLHRPSAALVLGAWAGFLAAVSFLPTALPVLWQVVDAAQEAGLEQADRAARMVRNDLDEGKEPDERAHELYGVDHLAVDQPGHAPLVLGSAVDPALVAEACKI